ncbi:hypothetical protein [Streptomyces sp. FL07-04A]|nr:hypothetical protein [Streptomyces sp. FL07-04A]MDX3579011.1 hypothetical protein [Streptomyces sp. FL07-04A]
MEVLAIGIGLYVVYKWGQKDAYKRGFDDGVKNSKKYTLVVKEKEEK